MAKLSDVAARAGVSVSAVSRVLSGDPSARLSEATRERVRKAAGEVGYHPNFAGRALKLARTDVIALIVPDVTNSLFADLTRGVEDEAVARGCVMLLARSEDMQPGGSMFDRLVGEGRVDGIVLQPRDGTDPEELAQSVGVRAPIVTIHQRIPGASSVVVPDARAARLATEHLIALGHRRIGFAGGLAGSPTAQRRAAGYAEALEAAGIAHDPALVTWRGYREPDGRASTAELLALPQRPTAIVAANVNAAVGVLAQARAQGLAVPQELSVVAVHDAWTAAHTWPPLTCVRMPLYELGRTAVSALANVIDGGPVEHRSVEDPGPVLVERESTAAPRG
ncbi:MULTISPECIES: LacI family DNA-binding transcriptional regulator [Glycomyces]|uniref:LacI family DNA-binding transcriptional regulator n=2 Tax=Glycomyces TaxID=58113 RepID=A0A9X3PR85_9ACTN|nr:LacI family DNA-binding transcriptional regulator [Glycomyces lechevalierae]MDA1384008.1 LacI family DNA-binding transcriptional regulator [Glycomyces lechevalierae]MDR7340998.1 LacI family transcriptional regulator [Glycomyces lechevalierae]